MSTLTRVASVVLALKVVTDIAVPIMRYLTRRRLAKQVPNTLRLTTSELVVYVVHIAIALVPIIGVLWLAFHPADVDGKLSVVMWCLLSIVVGQFELVRHSAIIFLLLLISNRLLRTGTSSTKHHCGGPVELIS